MVKISSVSTTTELKRFVHVPYVLQGADPLFVSDLQVNNLNLLRHDTNPFFKDAELKAYLATRNGELVGRIASINNKTHRKEQPDLGRFGFFDSVNDPEVAQALFRQVDQDMQAWGVRKIIGPLNPSFNDSIGILVEGFDHPPYYEMPHNPDYYEELILTCGLHQERDYLAYLLSGKDFPDRLRKAAPVLLDRFTKRGIEIRCLNPDYFDQEVEAIRQVYNSAWISNHEFAPASKAQFKFYFDRYRKFLDPELVLLALDQGEIIGFVLAMPNMNEVYAKSRNGKVTWLQKLSGWNSLKGIKNIRIMATGILEHYRRLGIESYFYIRLFELAKEKNLHAAEASRIAEDNEPMINAMPYKRYRIFSKEYPD